MGIVHKNVDCFLFIFTKAAGDTGCPPWGEKERKPVVINLELMDKEEMQ